LSPIGDSAIIMHICIYTMKIPNAEPLGLTDKESELYGVLISLGEADAARLIAETGFKRPTVYKSLYSMIEKGLVKEAQKLGKSFFKPESPQQILKIAERRYKELDRARNDFSRILPELLTQFTLSTERPVVTTFQGVKGLKKIYEDMLNTAKPINAALYTGEVEPELFKWLTTDFTQERIARKIPVRSIVASGGWADEYEKRNDAEMRETKLVDSSKYPMRHELDVYGDKIAFIDFQKGGNLIGIVINHPALASTMRAWFALTWDTK
jgi:sugar-specific transcriptional regulator TrmB